MSTSTTTKLEHCIKIKMRFSRSCKKYVFIRLNFVGKKITGIMTIISNLNECVCVSANPVLCVYISFICVKRENEIITDS